jgi:hypothetical protein
MAATNVRYGQSVNGIGVASNGTSGVVVHTFGAALKGPDAVAGPGGIVDMVRVYNSDTIAHIVNLYLIPPSQSGSGATIIDRITLQPNEIYRFVGPERAPSSTQIVMTLGEAHAAAAVYAKADVSEIY